MTRDRKSLNALRDAVTAIQPAGSVQYLVLDGVPRTGLTAHEISQAFGVPYRWLLTQIRDGRVQGLREYVIPVSELAEIAKWAEYLDHLT
jgi:hypothetical protein